MRGQRVYIEFTQVTGNNYRAGLVGKRDGVDPLSLNVETHNLSQRGSKFL